jgi:hypothetical protein
VPPRLVGLTSVTLCDIESALSVALREMDRLQLTLAVIERQHERMVT